MPSTYTLRNRLEKQEPGENSNNWGTRLNGNMIDLVDAALDGVAAIAVDDDLALSTADGSSDQARSRVLVLSGAGGRTVTIPNVQKNYQVVNGSSGIVTFSTGTGTSAQVRPGANALIACDGNNVVRDLLSNLGVVTFTNAPLVGNIPLMLRSLNPTSLADGADLTSSHNGRLVRLSGATGRTWRLTTIATGGWADGSFVILAPTNSGGITISRQSGVEMYYNGSNANRTIGQGGFGLLMHTGSGNEVWQLVGVGIT